LKAGLAAAASKARHAAPVDPKLIEFGCTKKPWKNSLQNVSAA
jgi:hypothetical protein